MVRSVCECECECVYVCGERRARAQNKKNMGGKKDPVLRNAVNARRAGGKSSAETCNCFLVILLYFIFYSFIVVFNFIGGVRAVSRPLSVVCLHVSGCVSHPPPHPWG